MRRIPPKNRIQNNSRRRNWMTKLMLKPAMAAYNASATADPSPEKRPDRQPLVMVRWTHKTFTGPTGAVMINPASRPRMRSSRPFIESGAPIGNRRHLVSPFQDRSYGTESLIMPRLDVGGDGRRRSWRFSKLGIPPTQDVGRRKRLPHGWPQSGLENVGRRKRLPHGWPQSGLENVGRRKRLPHGWHNPGWRTLAGESACPTGGHNPGWRTLAGESACP